ncbi:MAG: methionyl-tRNA formyltransferase [Candidatus Obscuribacterales bacterium]|nr:methionyl-tRNA formyltransferase [Candidatus Obscuribacterales bacterium]
MRVLFLGTPEFAVPSLEKLIQWKAVQVVGVVTQPDRPAGRGNNIFSPPTKMVAGRYDIPVLQPEKLSKAPDVVQAMRDLNPDILVTVAFGQILKKEVLTMAQHGVMNVHGSLLPKYRGAAPINWAIINGETVTGVTTMYSDKGVDTGKMLLKREMEIYPDMNAEMLAEAMSFVGADLLVETLDKLMSGSLEAVPQNDDEATFAPRLTKEMGQIDWNKSAKDIHNLARGLYPWPGTYSFYEGQQLKIENTILVAADHVDSSAQAPGTIIRETGKTAIGAHATQKGALMVACGPEGKERIILNSVKPANKGRMDALAWANGLRLQSGARFTNPTPVPCKD